MRVNWHRPRTWLVACCLALALQQIASAGLIHGKALLAPVLVQRAWEQQLTEGKPVKPWPWADTWPVARLRVPALNVDQFVLAGASGNALAFGPGLDQLGATPGDPGVAVIGGHRDTHFRFLEGITRDMEVEIQRSDGRWMAFSVSGARVLDTRQPQLRPADTGLPKLELVTCYPFASIQAGGPLRYIVTARFRGFVS